MIHATKAGWILTQTTKQSWKSGKVREFERAIIIWGNAGKEISFYHYNNVPHGKKGGMKISDFLGLNLKSWVGGGLHPGGAKF